MTPKRRRYLAMAARTRAAYKAIDKHVTDGLVALDVKPSCSRGCAACCKLLITCTAPEAAAIMARFEPLVREVSPRLREDQDAFVALAKAAGLPLDRHGPGSTALELGLPAQWWALQRPCAFLGADNECRIYEARPVVCRTYMVASDPALCDHATGTEVSVIGVDYEGCVRAMESAAGEPLLGNTLAGALLALRKEMD